MKISNDYGAHNSIRAHSHEVCSAVAVEPSVFVPRPSVRLSVIALGQLSMAEGITPVLLLLSRSARLSYLPTHVQFIYTDSH